jgi:Flp pilus assembly protein TadD
VENETCDPALPESREAILLRRARKHLTRGERRQAMLALREACYYTGQDPKLWALYGVQCWRMRRLDDAADALRQAIWLREREPNDRRAGALRALLGALEQGRSHGSLRAA